LVGNDTLFDAKVNPLVEPCERNIGRQYSIKNAMDLEKTVLQKNRGIVLWAVTAQVDQRRHTQQQNA
jgi:hypothetical protein